MELAIADHINGAGIAWPSIKHLSGKTKLSERQVQRVIKKLEQTGELVILRDRRYHRYKITLGDKMSDVDKLSDIKDDIQCVEDDIQGTIGDTQGTIGDTAESVKSLITINKITDETIKETENYLILKTPAEDIWGKLLKALKEERNNLYNQIYFLHDISLDGDLMTVWVSSMSDAEILNNQVAKLIERFLVGIVAKTIHVKFVVKAREHINA